LKLTGKPCGASFFDAACYRIFLTRFLNSLNSFQVKLHAYSLRPKEIYLLATPSSPTGISNLLNSTNQAYSEYFNERFNRAINVWGGPTLSSPVLEDQFCLNCQKYIERIALRDLDIDHPGAYEWSSYCLNAFGSKTRFLSPHPAYLKFLNGTTRPYHRYREFIAAPFGSDVERHIRNTLSSSSFESFPVNTISGTDVIKSNVGLRFNARRQN